MIKIRQNYFATATIPDLSKWLLILCLTIIPMEAANSVEDLWALAAPTSRTVVFLVLWLLGFFIVCFSLYRILLKSQVRQGVHPHILAYTLILFGTGGYLLVLFLSLLDQIGLGWFIVIGSLYLFILLMLVMLGKALKFIVLFLFFLIVVIAFQFV